MARFIGQNRISAIFGRFSRFFFFLNRSECFWSAFLRFGGLGQFFNPKIPDCGQIFENGQKLAHRNFRSKVTAVLKNEKKKQETQKTSILVPFWEVKKKCRGLDGDQKSFKKNFCGQNPPIFFNF